MTTIVTPIHLIDALRDTDPYIKTIYKKGGCYKFHLFLKSLWPNALPVKNKSFDHVGSIINGVCYDIDGFVKWDWYAMSYEEIRQAEDWCFADSHYLSIGECSACDEPLVV